MFVLYKKNGKNVKARTIEIQQFREIDFDQNIPEFFTIFTLQIMQEKEDLQLGEVITVHENEILIVDEYYDLESFDD